MTFSWLCERGQRGLKRKHTMHLKSQYEDKLKGLNNLPFADVIWAMGWSLTERLDRTWHDMRDRLGDKTTNWRCSCRPCPRSDSYSRRGVQRSNPSVSPVSSSAPPSRNGIGTSRHAGHERLHSAPSLSLSVAVKINRWRARSIARPTRLPLG